jgi:ATP-binding protein involved in chromosome partitioning
LPGIGRAIADVGRVVNVTASDGSLDAQIELGFPAQGRHVEYRSHIVTAVAAEMNFDSVKINLSTKIVAHGVQRNLKPLPNVRNIIAIASGKGGVGKSTVAVNVAIALAADGASVGLLDADIYGPSQPHMVGLAGKQPQSEDGRSMQPLEAHGLQVMSIGFLIDPDQPMIWRGPMVTSALQQLLNQTTWRDLDYLIVDMPPGTGDIQLTLSQQVPVSGAVIVTTPQNIATLDARKGLAMFRKVSVPVLGVIENMSTTRPLPMLIVLLPSEWPPRKPPRAAISAASFRRSSSRKVDEHQVGSLDPSNGGRAWNDRALRAGTGA